MIVSGTGRISEDLILQTSKNGNEYVSFSLAHERGYGDKKETDWYSCRVVGEAAKRIASLNIKKGTLLFISGALETPTYVGKDNVKRQNVNINVLWWQFVSTGKPKSENAEVGMGSNEEYVPLPESNVVSADDELPLA